MPTVLMLQPQSKIIFFDCPPAPPSTKLRMLFPKFLLLLSMVALFCSASEGSEATNSCPVTVCGSPGINGLPGRDGHDGPKGEKGEPGTV